MAEMLLEFYVKDQTLVRKKDGQVPRKDSEGYLFLKFNFIGQTWENLSIIPWIGYQDENKQAWSVKSDIAVDLNRYQVPVRYLGQDYFLVSLSGNGTDGTKISTNVVKVSLAEASSEIIDLPNLPEDAGGQSIVDLVNTAVDAAQVAAESVNIATKQVNEATEKINEAYILTEQAQKEAAAAREAAQEAIGAAPSVDLESIEDGVTITVTKADGTTKQEIVHNGEAGPTGPAGPVGADGFSPTAKVTQTETGAIITITDKDGTTEATVKSSSGKGIASVEQTAESQESGGENVLTITLTDGTKTDFIVRNGSGTGTVTETVESDNIFDPSIAIKGGLFYPSASGFQIISNNWSYYAYVPLKGAGVYKTILNWSQHEYTGGNIALLKEDKTLSQIVSGTYIATEDRTAYLLSFVVTQEMIDSGAYYIGFDCDAGKLSEAMIVKNRDYPEVYIPFGEIEKTTPVGAGRLFEKTALFFGDSICAGTTIEVDAKKGYGWAGLIGVKNYMDWKNYGKDGGTVTDIADVNSNLWLSTQVTNAIAEYPEADYLVLEGGCNDADLLHEEGLGEISVDYVNFDENTFSGALEALILRLLTAYPKAKLAYVIPQKMGAWGTNFNGRIYVTYFERAKEICKKWGVPVQDLWNECPLNPLLTAHYNKSVNSFYTDGQHLTLAGYEYITPKIEAFMERL